MVTSTSAAQSLGVLPPLVISPQTSTNSMDSFAQQLAATLEAYLGQTGTGSPLEIDINPTQSQNTGDRQFIVTIKNPPATAAPASPSAPAAAAAPATAAPASATVPVDPATLSPDSVIRTDEYWALQPAAVQQLRDIPDMESRAALGQQLAKEGYTIDPTIMVYGWNPYQTMKNRQDAGYTWVPSLGQSSNIMVPPGMTFPGLASYDPNNPPAGSIRVTTDFSSATS